MKTKVFARLLLMATFATVLICCKKNAAEKGEKSDGIYYNERTGKNGSSDTTAATHESPAGETMQSAPASDSTQTNPPK